MEDLDLLHRKQIDALLAAWTETAKAATAAAQAMTNITKEVQGLVTELRNVAERVQGK